MHRLTSPLILFFKAIRNNPISERSQNTSKWKKNLSAAHRHHNRTTYCRRTHMQRIHCWEAEHGCVDISPSYVCAVCTLIRRPLFFFLPLTFFFLSSLFFFYKSLPCVACFFWGSLFLTDAEKLVWAILLFASGWKIIGFDSCVIARELLIWQGNAIWLYTWYYKCTCLCIYEEFHKKYICLTSAPFNDFLYSVHALNFTVVSFYGVLET